MIVFRLAAKSLLNRWGMVLLTVACIALSVALVVGVEKVRTGAKASFASTISGTDLILGARSGNVQLLLYSVFHIGEPLNNVTWQTYQEIANRPEVKWIVPLSLGDSHRGFRVVGTTAGFFEHMRYRDEQRLQFELGGQFQDLFDAVIGADVAASLGYDIGTQMTLAHGTGSVAFAEHAALPFTVAGILKRTGTPIDKSIHVGLESIEAIHVDWQSGAAAPAGQATPADTLRQMDLEPKVITAAMIGLQSPISTFALQRFINDYPEEPLTALLPGMTLLELWAVMEIAETGLRVVAALVVATALLGMITTILAMLNERRREMAILRSVGAAPSHIFGLLVSEALAMGILGTALGMLLAYGVLLVSGPWLEASFGLFLPLQWPTTAEWIIALIVIVGAAAAGLIPAVKAYRNSLADGISLRT